MRAHRWLAIVAAGILGAVGALPRSANATWLGLEDGTYNVTLECLFSSVIACPSTLHGQVTIAGAGASFLAITVNGEVFSGDPVDDDLIFADAHREQSRLTNVPFSFADLRWDVIPDPTHVDPRIWSYCHNLDATHCTLGTSGIWSAVAVPEPATLGLFALGLAGLGLSRRRAA